MPQHRSSQRHPFESLLLLLLLCVAGMIVFSILAFVLGGLIYGPGLLFNLTQALSGINKEGLNFLKILQICSAIGTFIVPAFIFARIESREPRQFLHLVKPPANLLFLLAILLVFASGPLIELAVAVNRDMKLPAALKGIEEWMKAKEYHLADLTRKLLLMDSFGGLMVNMLMIAVLPALGEELLFRGCMQQVLARWIKNHHAAIWITAIIFSAIHVQFYGFIPRMLLGALLGYLFFWGRSIWLPVIAHFINNGISVVAAYIYQRQGQSLDKLDDATMPAGYAACLTSLLFTALLLWLYYKNGPVARAGIDTDGERLG